MADFCRLTEADTCLKNFGSYRRGRKCGCFRQQDGSRRETMPKTPWIRFAVVLMAVAGWMNQRRFNSTQIQSLREENRVLPRQLGTTPASPN